VLGAVPGGAGSAHPAAEEDLGPGELAALCRCLLGWSSRPPYRRDCGARAAHTAVRRSRFPDRGGGNRPAGQAGHRPL